MSTVAKGQYRIEAWDEKEYGALAAPQKATKSDIRFMMTGDLEGPLDAVYTMHYLHDEQAVFNGLHHFNGTLNGRQGGFCLIAEGEYRDKVASCRWRIVKGSGTGELAGISGEGGYRSEASQVVDYELDYTLDDTLE